jgi:ABC-2 type transport system ATP-binding protein
MEPIIDLDGLSIRFGSVQALKNLRGSYSARSLGLLGPNGAGKTTLIHTLLGFHKPDAGTARVFGNDIRHQDRAARALIGYMPERDSFIAGMSAVRFVRMMAELSGIPPAHALERAHEALYHVGLGESRYRDLDQYSQGMKQRAKLAQALVHGPRLLFLDEPTNGLDPPARERMIQLIKDIRDSGEIHVVLSSHLLRDVEECCEEVLILKRGEIAYHCNLEEERRANRKFLELEVRGDVDGYVESIRKLGVECVPYRKRRIKMVLPPELEIRELYKLAAERTVEIRHLDYKKDSLQDIFLKAMEEAPAPAAN